MLAVQDFVLQGPDEDGGLAVCLKRCRSSKFHLAQKNGVALVFAHCIGQHKETWIPTVEHLFDLQEASSCNATRVTEAWLIDCSNHGHAAILNEDAFHDRPKGITGREWARALRVLFESGLIQGSSIVGVGHSAGGATLIQSASQYPQNAVPYASIILVDPGIMSPPTMAMTPLKEVIQLTKKKRDIWDSREAARVWMSKRPPWNRWDPSVLDSFVAYGLRDLPTALYPDKTRGVTLCATLSQESAGYGHEEAAFEALDLLKSICSIIPVHCIWAGMPGVVSKLARKEITDEAEGRCIASSVEIPGTTHLVPQENPAALAAAIWKAIQYRNNLLCRL